MATQLKPSTPPVRITKELNILIIGETGVGKSTFINGFANYITYESFEQAVKHGQVNVIPLQFSITNEDYEEEVIACGEEDQNEVVEAGKSATQNPKSYIFEMTDAKIRLIDTPGIGDCRGKDQDKQHFENLMSHLHHIDEIHGVCILQNPNNPRLTENFLYCIEELLTYLHKNACKNITFIFCKTKAFNYKPGDSFPLLKKLMKKHSYDNIAVDKSTVYCLDNESVRLLAEHKKRGSIDEKQALDGKYSWEKSASEIHRLLGHISRLKPHCTTATLSLNNAKRMVWALADPMMQICKTIEDNIALATNKRVEIATIEESNENLKKLLRIKKIVPETKDIENPKLICASQKCIKTEMVDGVPMETYGQCCHDDCYIPGMRFLNSFPWLNKLCKVMKSGICTQCGCSWDFHKHITYEYVNKVVYVTNEDTKRQLNDNVDKMVAVHNFFANIDKHVEQLKGEQDTIIRTAAQFGIFLKQNSIITTSDFIVESLKQPITIAKAVHDGGGNGRKLEDLQRMLKDYEHEMQEFQNVGIRITPTEVNTLMMALYELPINGDTMKKCVKTALDANTRMSQKLEVTYKSVVSMLGKYMRW